MGPSGAIIDRLPDDRDVLHRVLPRRDDAAFTLLNRIEWYDDTDFESDEMDSLLAEIDLVGAKPFDPADKAYLSQLRRLAKTCRINPALRLRFVGD